MLIFRRSQLRLLVGDATENDGPRPGQVNFQDEELDALLLLEGDDLNRAAARVFEVLAAEWSRYAGSYRLGPESEEMRQAQAFADRALTWREMYGYTTPVEAEGSGDSAVVDWSAVYRNWLGKF
jgi:hypothetical protein